MNKCFIYEKTQNRLRIFISSRIKECSEERSIVRKAIHALNHEPVLFEHLGASTLAPRDLYLSYLNDSQIMVAIYRSGYGYIDSLNGMRISGLEDEYQYSKNSGIASLFYIFSDKTNRDQRLADIISDASKTHTLFFYDNPIYLEDRVKTDLTRLITERFLRADLQQNVFKETPYTVLSRTKNVKNNLFLSQELLTKFESQLNKHHLLIITGKHSSGKTTFAAKLSELMKAIYLRVTNLTPKEIFSLCTAALKKDKNQLFATLQGARLAFASTWAENNDFILIIDECDYITEIINTVNEAGGASSTKRLLFTNEEPLTSFPYWELPSIQPENDILTNYPNKYCQESIGLFSNIINDLENGDYDNIKSSTREILSYLCLTEVPLLAHQLLKLIGNDHYTIENIYSDIECMLDFIDDTPRGFKLVDNALFNNYRGKLLSCPQKLLFYTKRLVNLFEEEGDYRTAYLIAKISNTGLEKHLSNPALRQASQLGDWRIGLTIAEDLLSGAFEKDYNAEAFYLMLSLIYPLELMGNSLRASEFLEKSRQLAKNLDENAQFFLKEIETISNARRTLSHDDISSLNDLYKIYGEQGRGWDQARIGIELSALYLNSKLFSSAINILRPTLDQFIDLEDEYGIDIAERNLATALVALPGNEIEAEALLKKIEERSELNTDTRRQRAWICNIQTRKLRIMRKFNEAEMAAKESITLAKDLGDEALCALNYINLGNVYSDTNDYNNALQSYMTAGRLAQKCARHDIEAESSRLHAEILNNCSSTVDNNPDNFKQAKIFAQYAIAVYTNSINHHGRAQAYIELGRAEENLHNKINASKAYFNAAGEFLKSDDSTAFDEAILVAIDLSLPEYEDIYLNGLAEIFNSKFSQSDNNATKYFDLIPSIISDCPVRSFISILGRHIQQIKKETEDMFIPGLNEAAIDRILPNSAKDLPHERQVKLLLSGIIFSCLIKEDKRPFMPYKLAKTITSNVDGIHIRQLDENSLLWTVALNFNCRLILSIIPIDHAPSTIIASLCIPFFLKAFENDLSDLIPNIVIDELLIWICSYKEMPSDIKDLIGNIANIENILSSQPCVITRPTSFEETLPTMIILSDSFLDNLSFGKGAGGSLQILFGMMLIELIYQFLQCEINIDDIRPKIISLIRKTLS